ncbi:N-acetylmuramoyl-L-alanine amidase [Peribacillus frigoritolerans]|uniref:N-acetylmuramoyl-L-alanine amidase n=1 Tax=Peribacillus frigoritolerans TaxID=450367 RepID=UPI002E20F070|nr:N-acetylmuramoyl-L-alanine amidase [Peribacillus frigoritolerans]MED3848841.1 N-acetylmuramoyl-L-alanine amidase [Peribacillus frigoritolerans]
MPKVAEYLKELSCKVHTVNDDTSKTQRDNINTLVKYHNSKNRDLDVSVHFNAGTKETGGTEDLYYGDGNKALAARVSKAISEALGIKDRGAKKRIDLGFLKGTSKPAILIEVCFVDTKTNADAYKKNFDKCYKAIAETLSGKNLKEEAIPVEKKSVLHKVQVGAFSDEKNAENVALELKKKGYSTVIVYY